MSRTVSEIRAERDAVLEELRVLSRSFDALLSEECQVYWREHEGGKVGDESTEQDD